MKKRVKDIVDIDVLFDTKLKTIKGAGFSAFFCEIISESSLDGKSNSC